MKKYGKNFRTFVKYLRRMQESGRVVDVSTIHDRLNLLLEKCPYRDGTSRSVIYIFSKAFGRTAATLPDGYKRNFYAMCKKFITMCWSNSDKMLLPFTLGFITGLDAEHLELGDSHFRNMWDRIVPEEDKVYACAECEFEDKRLAFELIPNRYPCQKLRVQDTCFFRKVQL